MSSKGLVTRRSTPSAHGSTPPAWPTLGLRSASSRGRREKSLPRPRRARLALPTEAASVRFACTEHVARDGNGRAPQSADILESLEPGGPGAERDKFGFSRSLGYRRLMNDDAKTCPSCGGAGGGPFGRPGSAWDTESYVCLRCEGLGVLRVDVPDLRPLANVSGGALSSAAKPGLAGTRPSVPDRARRSS